VPLVGSAKSIFKFYSIGVSTNRDEWVFDFDSANLESKMRFFVKEYNHQVDQVSKIRQTRKLEYKDLGDVLEYKIKWSRALKDKLWRKTRAEFRKSHIIDLLYRPYVLKKYYSDKALSDFLTANHYMIFGPSLTDENLVICFSGVGSTKPFAALATNRIWSLDLIEKTQGVPLYTYQGDNRDDNVTEWARMTFRRHYNDASIGSADIFHYVYAILNSPSYRGKYGTDLKKELPRVPFFKDFWKWSKLGERLVNLHIGHIKVKSFAFTRKDNGGKSSSEAKMKVDRNSGRILLDGRTLLEGLPKGIWDYRIGSRSAVEWIIDQYRDWQPTELILRQDYHTYQFKDYKEHVIDLVGIVAGISLETENILQVDGSRHTREMGDK
jgi:predicted helicase